MRGSLAAKEQADSGQARKVRNPAGTAGGGIADQAADGDGVAVLHRYLRLHHLLIEGRRQGAGARAGELTSWLITSVTTPLGLTRAFTCNVTPVFWAEMLLVTVLDPATVVDD